jgi:bifunctional DNA primase/polymerase-like protein/primase-like protein
VACQASGLVAFDIDSKHGADPREVIDELDLHDYPIVWTGEAGPPDSQHPNSLEGVRGAQVWFSGELPTTETSIAGTEIRGVGAYVMAIGSVHPSGVPYEGTVPPAAQLPPVPDRVRAIAVTEPASTNGRTHPDVWIGMLRDGIAEGSRHRSLLRLAGHYLRHYIDPDVAGLTVHVINLQCCRPPLPAADVDKLIEDVCKAELARRRSTGGRS